MATTSGVDAETVARIEGAPIDAPVFRDVIAKRRPVRLRNPGGRPEATGLPATQPPTHSSLAVPIASPTQVYGCLSLRNKLGADSFSDRDEEVALTLATHAGIAYENARLNDNLRSHSAALEREVVERRRAEARTQVALAAARMGIWEYEFASDRVKWSDSLTEICGLSAARAPTTSEEFFALIHPDDRGAVKAAFERAVGNSTDLVNEFRTISPHGHLRWIAGRARTVRDASGTAAGMIGVGIDVSELKLLEEQFRQAQKMEAVGQLAGGVAHDFNNLLTAIHGYASLLFDSLSENDTRRADVAEIIKAAERAARLTRQLLAFSRKQILQPTGWETVLLVEDDRAVRKFARGVLDRAGYRVLEAENAGKAQEIVRQHADRIHVLVSDLIMPGLSGPSLFERLAAERPDIKVLYISGYSDDAFIQQSGLPPDVPFLQKPFTAGGLLCKVREVIDR
jgi:PAS domain S-box-containing protein